MRITDSQAVYHICALVSSPYPHLTPITRYVILSRTPPTIYQRRCRPTQ
jgi:hypothetical protein